jgi:general secretion pathway protein D
LNALTEITDLRVISSPQLMVLDNQSARLQIGDQVPIATQTSVPLDVAVSTDPNVSSLRSVNQIQFRDTGVILEVTPRVNASGLVSLDIFQEVSDVVPTDEPTVTPTIQQRSIQTTVAVQSGETVALGGLIRDKKDEAVTGVPILSAIPILGNLFKTTTNTTRRTELLVLITPRVVRDRTEAREVTEELRRRLGALGPLWERIEALE